MLKQFTVVSNEIVEHGAIESIMMQFYYDPEEVKDPEKNLRKAVLESFLPQPGTLLPPVFAGRPHRLKARSPGNPPA